MNIRNSGGNNNDNARNRRAQQPNGRLARSRYDVRKRLMIVGGILSLSSVALLAFAVDRQLIHSDFYREQGSERYQRDVEIPINRGMITDRHGEPLAVSTPVMSLWVNPLEIANNPAEINRLADALGYPRNELARMISEKSKKEFLWLRRRINPAAAQKVLAMKIPGLYGQREFKRFYPQGEAMAHVLGFTSIEDHGQEGMELAFDEWLSGTPGKQRVLRDRRGRAIESVDLLKAAEPGKDLALSIDRRIQYLTYKELNKAVTESGASSGSAVVIDIRTGEVLAMANVPSFNPNAVSTSKRDAHRNRAVTDLFEPGSTIKPLTVAAALEAGKITPTTLWNTSPGWIANGNYRTTDTHNYGTLTTTGLITKSSNVGMSLVVRRLSDRQFYDFLRKMGYGKRTNSGFPGEGSGLLADPSRWDGTQKQTMSYGYSLSVTPLQVARAYATLANNGQAITPTFLKGGTGETTEALSPKVAHEVMKMMQTVTEPGGTATQAAILGYHVAGKTGTARIASGGSYDRRYLAYFAGVAPVDNPRFSMVVVINDPDRSRGYYGGVVSAPVFRNVIEGALRLDDVPPDDLQSWLAANTKTKAKPAAPAAAAAPVQPAEAH